MLALIVANSTFELLFNRICSMVNVVKWSLYDTICGIAISKSTIGKVLVDSCRVKLLRNATLPCAYTYVCLGKNHACVRIL